MSFSDHPSRNTVRSRYLPNHMPISRSVLRLTYDGTWHKRPIHLFTMTFA